MTNYNPSLDPANLETLVGAFRVALNKLVQNMDGMLPAQVVAVNAGPPMTVDVQPLIMMLSSDETAISRAPLASIPVQQMGGGNILLSFPVAEGDLGWILANDRDISTYIQNFKETPPSGLRKKNFSDSIFIPAILSGYTINPINDGSAVLQTKDGTVSIAISETGIILTGPITVVGALTVQGGLSVTGAVTGTFDITGDLTINSTSTVEINSSASPSLAITGNAASIVATGTITP